MTYTEDALVEQPAIELFAKIGWQTLDCFGETFGAEGMIAFITERYKNRVKHVTRSGAEA